MRHLNLDVIRVELTVELKENIICGNKRCNSKRIRVLKRKTTINFCLIVWSNERIKNNFILVVNKKSSETRLFFAFILFTVLLSIF